ncbi:MAG: PH domain-containing protein [Bacillota bacterium]|nr:PH domain-containing protein [Bacillota bacterium]
MPEDNAIDRDQILWKDRKRHFGMPISFTRYELTSVCLTVRRGFFSTTTDETMLYRILDTRLHRTLGQKIFGVGTIILYTADRTCPELPIRNVRKSEEVHRLLGHLIEAERDRKAITARELYGSTDYGVDRDGDGIPDHLQ